MSKNSSGKGSNANANHHANQCNPNNGAHRAAANNHSNQCNPNNAAYHSSRGGKK